MLVALVVVVVVLALVVVVVVPVSASWPYVEYIHINFLKLNGDCALVDRVLKHHPNTPPYSDPDVVGGVPNSSR